MPLTEKELREQREAAGEGSEQVAQVSSTRLRTARFDLWTYQDAIKALKSLQTKQFDIYRRYASGEHFAAEEWIGPGNPVTNAKIEKQFAPDDATGESLWNVSNAFQEAQIGLAPLEPLPADQDLAPEVKRRKDLGEALLTQLWDNVFLHDSVQDRLRVSGWAGFAMLRPWVPGRFMEVNGGQVGFVPVDDLEQAFEMIAVSAPDPAAGAVFTDPNTMDKCVVFSGTDVDSLGKDRKFVELIFLDPLRIRDQESKTIFRILYEDESTPPLRQELELGGRLLGSQMNVRRLFTDAVIRTQRQLNLLTSLITRMGETAAFRGRYTKNAKPIGTRTLWEEGEAIPAGSFIERDDEDRQWLVTPVERTLGAATTTDLVGLDKFNTEGDLIGHETPDVFLEDPVDPTAYINAAESVRRRLLRMCSQGHLAGTSNFEVSGIAYEQARAVFAKDLKARKSKVEGVLRDLLTTVLHLAEYIADQPGYFTKMFRVTVEQHVDPGPRSPDSVRLDHEAYEKSLLSQETAMSLIGVEDLNAERERIKASPQYIVELLEKAVPALEGYDESALKELLKLFRLPEALVNAMKQKEEPAPVVAPPKPAPAV